jgi:hypothetical protein
VQESGREGKSGGVEEWKVGGEKGKVKIERWRGRVIIFN